MAARLSLLALPGDGIGPEIVAATCAVVDAVADVDWQEARIGFAALEAAGTTIPDAVIAAATAADGVVLGPVSHNAYPPREEGGLNPSGVLRKSLDLYANIRPARSLAGEAGPLGRPVDLIVARENLEGFYADRNMESGPGEVMVEPGVSIALRKITARGSARIARAAFALARGDGRRVTVVHKANVMRLTDGVFLDEVRRTAAEHPSVAYDEMLVDAAAAHLVRDPGRFDIIVTTNMFGDILSDLASELAGGLGLAASLNHGDTHAVAQAQHGSAPDIAGQDRANPSSLIGSAAMLLRHLGRAGPADRIDRALARVLADPRRRTGDLGGPLGTRAFVREILTELEHEPA